MVNDERRSFDCRMEIGATLFPNDFFVETLTHTIVLCWACIVFVAFMLSICGLLSGLMMLLGVGGIGLAAWPCWSFARGSNSIAEPHNKGQKWWPLCCGALGILGWPCIYQRLIAVPNRFGFPGLPRATDRSLVAGWHTQRPKRLTLE